MTFNSFSRHTVWNARMIDYGTRLFSNQDDDGGGWNKTIGYGYGLNKVIQYIILLQNER